MQDFGPLAMTYEELEEFLRGEPPRPAYVAVATVRKDGSPFVAPVGYLYEDGYIYVSYAPATSAVKRIRRDPRVCLTVFNDHYPVRFAIITGVAEEYDDPTQELERRKFFQNMRHAEDILDIEEYFRIHESAGRVVFRVPVRLENVAAMDASKVRDPQTQRLLTPEEVRGDQS
jgi:nitroimidazol reductase NimA-like FMN-containing flavoprotein (pyridoxamine 5'-phosphate oxidase superfamily)